MKTSYKIAIVASLLTVTSVFGRSDFIPQQARSADTPTTIELNVTVKNGRDEVVRKLSQRDFQVSIDGNPTSITSFKNDEGPASIGILFDASSSTVTSDSAESAMKNLTILRAGLERLMRLNNQRSEYFLIGFNQEPQLLQDWTSDRSVLLAKFGQVRPLGGTSLYDACYLGIDKVQSGRYGKRVLIVMSDGKDNASRYSLRELEQLLKESDVLLYAVHFFNPGPGVTGSLGTQGGHAVLQGLTSVSGGAALFGKSSVKDVYGVFETIASELKGQYTIGISVHPQAEVTKWRKIKVKAIPPPSATGPMKDLSARAREGFYQR